MRGVSARLKRIPEKKSDNFELNHCETFTSRALQALKNSENSDKDHIDKVIRDHDGLVALDIAIDVLGGSHESFNHTNNLSPPSPSSHSFDTSNSISKIIANPPVSSPQQSESAPFLDSKKVNQISLSPIHLPDLILTKPSKKIGFDEYKARQQTKTKKVWTRQECIDEYARRDSLKEACDLVIPKKTSFSPIYRPKPSVRKNSNPLKSPVPSPIHNNELAPENLEFEPVDPSSQISEEFNLAWELGLLTPPRQRKIRRGRCHIDRDTSIISSSKDVITSTETLVSSDLPRNELNPPIENERPEKDVITSTETLVSSDLPQNRPTSRTPCNLPTIDTDPNYDHFPLFEKIKEEFDRLARSPTPPQDSENCNQISTVFHHPSTLPQPSPSQALEDSTETSSSSLPPVNCSPLSSSSVQSDNSTSSLSTTSSDSSSSESLDSDSSTNSSSSDSSSTSSQSTSTKSDVREASHPKPSNDSSTSPDWKRWDRCFKE
ncbi:hypothetical protein QAD02_024423 [Eretmocerus hayati]|uniref:Uncharacterized protein n=1 Tax=Eretmocerus hayati TaxID=131215 RepID=A0ACC2PYP7_9HYME|nr:hypothetical protein QAD02_024423 [Eretmocerus hayati]